MGAKGCRILAEGHTASNDTWKTGLNNNDLIIGPSGAGKTRGYVLPNILTMEDSFVVADTKGNLYKKTGDVLKKKGFKVMCIDFTDCAASPYGYNPLAYIGYDRRRKCHSEQDILKVAACLVPLQDMSQPYWELAGRMYLECLIGYVFEACPESDRNIPSILRLFEEKVANAFYFQELMRELEVIHPESFAVRRYKMISGNRTAEKMDASIHGILAEKLSTLSFGGLERILCGPRQIRFAEIGRRKTAVFLNISDTDRSLDKIVNLFYVQIFQELCREADRRADSRLKVPVRVILDDFASGTVIPDFDKLISVIRSREISVSIIIQSLSQLDSLYGSNKAKTILNNCDHCLYLGGQDMDTAKFCSQKINRPASVVLNMGLDEMWLFTRGKEPEKVKKFRLAEMEKEMQMEQTM